MAEVIPQLKDFLRSGGDAGKLYSGYLSSLATGDELPPKG
jgi:hypothetical protein